MRTTINVPDQIIDQLMALSDVSTKTEAVNKAILDWVKFKKIQKLKSLRGKLKIENYVDNQRLQEINEIDELNE